MKIHEYQAKELLKHYGIPVLREIVASTPEEALSNAEKIGPCVLKAQIHSGGRGKVGGVRYAATPAEAKQTAEQMIGMNLVTPQTGPEGKTVRKLLICEPAEIKKEYYVSITGDTQKKGLLIIASESGGTEIEEMSKSHPEKIVQIPISVIEGFRNYEGIYTAEALHINHEHQELFVSILRSMVDLYLEKDCSLIEINPLAETLDGKLVCLDAKINFDDNALYRHPEIIKLRDIYEEDSREYKASLSNLSYVSLTGNIGCMVNGAGLAMATMDIIKKFGGEPANFLDVGGSATSEKVSAAMEILLSSPHIKSIFVNIFGGIMKCDVIAEGILNAYRPDISIPVILRLDGTNVEKGKQLLKESGYPFIMVSDMAEGAQEAVNAAERGIDL